MKAQRSKTITTTVRRVYQLTAQDVREALSVSEGIQCFRDCHGSWWWRLVELRTRR